MENTVQPRPLRPGPPPRPHSRSQLHSYASPVGCKPATPGWTNKSIIPQSNIKKTRRPKSLGSISQSGMCAHSRTHVLLNQKWNVLGMTPITHRCYRAQAAGEGRAGECRGRESTKTRECECLYMLASVYDLMFALFLLREVESMKACTHFGRSDEGE